MIYWTIHIVLLGLLSYLIFRLVKSEFPPFVFWVGLIFKLAAGLILGYIFYEYYGMGDTITFFELAKKPESENLKSPRIQFFVALLKPLIQSTGGSYWITSLWLSFISFAACWYSVVILSSLYKTIKNLIAGCFLFVPSIVFWSSGILKDSLAFAAMVTLVMLAIKLYKEAKFSAKDVLILILSGFLLYKIKHYLFITSLLFFGMLITSLILRKIQGRQKWLIAIITLTIALGATQFIHPYLKISRIAWTLFENNQAINKKSDTSQLHIFIEDASWNSVVNEIPVALHTGLFRPSILDKTPAWGWIHKIENLILATLIFLSLLLCVKLKPDIDWPLFLAASLCILLLAIMLPLSTPNFGTLVRYKNAFMPFLLLLSSILPYQYLTSQSNE